MARSTLEHGMVRLPWLLILLGVLLAWRKKAAAAKPPSAPAPMTPAQREAQTLAAAQQTGLDLSGYPGRPGVRGGGVPAIQRDWGAQVLGLSVGQVLKNAMAAATNPELGPAEDERGRPTFRGRSDWLFRRLLDYVQGMTSTGRRR